MKGEQAETPGEGGNQKMSSCDDSGSSTGSHLTSHIDVKPFASLDVITQVST